MQMQYKKVVPYNHHSGVGRVECPYNTKLDNILKGDVTIMPLHTVRSLQLQCTLGLQAETAGPSAVPPTRATSQEGYPVTNE